MHEVKTFLSDNSGVGRVTWFGYNFYSGLSYSIGLLGSRRLQVGEEEPLEGTAQMMFILDMYELLDVRIYLSNC